MAYRNPISYLKLRRGIRIDEVRKAQVPVLVERGRDDSVLVIAFTGGAKMLMLPVYEFFETTKTLGCSRILLRDQYKQHYHRGIDDLRPDFPSLVAYLRDEIERLNPKKVLCIGTSAGGYAAIRTGHQLRADYVHAFSPQTGDFPASRGALSSRDGLRRWKERLRRHARTSPLDLAQILEDWNEKTTYYLHYCRSCDQDRYYAERLFRSPGVVSIGYPCNAHGVPVFLAKKGFLTKVLAIANQDKLVEIAKAHFRDGLEITEPRSETASGCSR